ncbi:MAG: polymerase, sigma-24 subunit, subfamily [Clostridiales bacterium]|nr:polymerase, sigma-24 subunit, subfamily [Clostridiales bacterium]
MNDEDSALIKKFQAGDNESFEKIIIKHRARALSFAQRYVHDPYEAEDIVQESFADIYVYRERYKNTYSFKTYLFTIIRNKSIDYIRKSKNLYLYENYNEKSVVTPEERYLEKEKNSLVRDMVNQLRDDYKTIIYLIEYYDFSYDDAAKIMGKNLGQIKVLVYRARKKLKTMLEKEG